MEEAVRQQAETSPIHSSAQTPPRSKGPSLGQKQSHKSILGNKEKKENFYGPSWGYVKFVQMGKPEKAWVWKETSPYQKEGLFLLGYSDWRLSHSSLVSFWWNRVGPFCLPLHMWHLIPHQGKAQVERNSHVGTALRCTASRRRCSCRTWLRPTSRLSLSFSLREAVYKELYSRYKLSLLLQQYYFPVSAFSCPKDTGSAPVACAHLGERAIHHCQETCCTQPVSSHLPLLLQRGLQILKRCITCTLQTAIHHWRAVPLNTQAQPSKLL